MADSKKKTPFWTQLFKKQKHRDGAAPLTRRLTLKADHRDQPLYSKLDASSRSIRLITILPGSWPEPISCRLHVTQLPPAPAPAPSGPYWALSYAWKNNDGAEDVPISLNGKVVPVSANLFSAMRRLRHRVGEPFDIWIDSLCINQKDDAERTHQVSLMRDIYRSSEEVIIWLGEAGTSDDVGQALLPAISPTPPRALASPPDEDQLTPIDWSGDERDRPKVAAYVRSVAAKASSPMLSSGRRDIFGAFAIIYLLSERVPASEIKHLRHIEYSTPIVRGLYAIMEMPWVGEMRFLSLPRGCSGGPGELWSDRVTVAAYLGGPGDGRR